MDKKEYLASEVLKVCRNQLYFKMRFMEQALFYLVPEQKEEVFFGSDAKKLYYNTLYILNKYRECPDIVTCSLLHVVIHCLFQHPLQAGSHTRKYWDLAADIAAADVIKEFCITDLVQCIPAGCFTIINILKREIPSMSVNHIYHYLKDNELHIEKLCGMETGKMADLFRMDCHDLWWHIASRPQYNGNGTKRLSEEWKETAENVLFAGQKFAVQYGSIRGDLPGSFTQNIKKLVRDNYDYSSFLRKFAVMEEQMKIDADEFDIVYYTYGLRQFKKIPLIEPLEYKEDYQIRDFVIAIDTSGSCSGELVQKFIQKTYSILKQTDNFSRKTVIHIIQCDACIQEDYKAESLQELEKYIENMQLKGFGGTDFCPVFQYVDKLIADGSFTRLCGLVYFTDGYGKFPKKPPGYKTAFVFVDSENDIYVPPWAMKLYLDGQALEVD